MSEDERQRRLLRQALAEEHRATRRRTPPFAELWARAAAEARPRRGRRPGLFAATAVAAAALALAVTLTLWNADRRARRELDRAMTIAAAVDEWRAPLDFLLDTPGRQWLETKPGWDPRAAAQPWALAPELLDPQSPQPDPSQETPR